jgi:transcriptional regulator with XRE-family HTH domain
MNAWQTIRVKVFRCSQIEMAEIAGVRQSTISRWENGLLVPEHTALKHIRNEAARRGIVWDDKWFFLEEA